ncbi:TraQ conjugal transfer family protein [Dysgonomonas reticulitermitis]
MKKFTSYFIYTVLLACTVCACSGDIDIKQDYKFKVTHLPVPKKIKAGEAVEIRLLIERERFFRDTTYKMRWFLFNGAGSIRFEDGTALLPNDYYPLDKDSFRLFFRAESNDTQSFELYFFDDRGNSHTLSFSFVNDSGGEEKQEL